MNDNTATPIIVPGSPTQAQLEALIRQVITVLGTVAGMAGYLGVAGKLNALLLIAGPIAGVIAVIWGQLHTRSQTQKGAALADMLPDNKAQTK